MHRILMLPKWYPSHLNQAEGNYVERHIIAISSFSNVVVLYVHSDSSLNSGEYLLTQSTENNYPVIRVFFKKHNRNLPFISNVIKLFRYIKAQRKGYLYIKTHYGRPHVTHVHHLTRNTFMALFLKYTIKIPFMITEHWSGFLPERRAYKGFLKRLVGQWALAQASCVTCVSSALKKGMEQDSMVGNFKIIPNVVDINIFKPIKHKLEGGKKKIIHISRLDTNVKNVPGILQAAKQLSNIRTDFEIHLVGDGVEADKQKLLAISLGLPKEMIIFHGYKTQLEVAALIGSADCLVVFSNYESQSCTMLEAFACGIPVIGTRVGGIPEFLSPERGILIDKQDINALCLAMETILNKTLKFDSDAIRTYAENNFAQPVIGQSFEQIYIDIIQRDC